MIVSPFPFAVHGGFVVFYAVSLHSLSNVAVGLDSALVQRESPFFTWFFLALRVFTILLALILRATIVAVSVVTCGSGHIYCTQPVFLFSQLSRAGQPP